MSHLGLGVSADPQSPASNGAPQVAGGHLQQGCPALAQIALHEAPHSPGAGAPSLLDKRARIHQFIPLLPTVLALAGLATKDVGPLPRLQRLLAPVSWVRPAACRACMFSSHSLEIDELHVVAVALWSGLDSLLVQGRGA